MDGTACPELTATARPVQERLGANAHTVCFVKGSTNGFCALTNTSLTEALFRESFVENEVMPQCAEVSSGSPYKAPAVNPPKRADLTFIH